MKVIVKVISMLVALVVLVNNFEMTLSEAPDKSKRVAKTLIQRSWIIRRSWKLLFGF